MVPFCSSTSGDDDICGKYEEGQRGLKVILKGQFGFENVLSKIDGELERPERDCRG